MGLHDEIREIAKLKFVSPAQRASKGTFQIAVKSLMREAEAAGVSTAGRVPAFCNSIRTRDFLDGNGVDIVGIDGPQSGLGTKVVVHYRFRSVDNGTDGLARLEGDPLMRLRGVLKGAMREGAAAFLRELRRDKEDEPVDDGKKVA